MSVLQSIQACALESLVYMLFDLTRHPSSFIIITYIHFTTIRRVTTRFIPLTVEVIQLVICRVILAYCATHKRLEYRIGNQETVVWRELVRSAVLPVVSCNKCILWLAGTIGCRTTFKSAFTTPGHTQQ
jgi:hypothetical protein